MFLCHLVPWPSVVVVVVDVNDDDDDDDECKHGDVTDRGSVRLRVWRDAFHQAAASTDRIHHLWQPDS